MSIAFVQQQTDGRLGNATLSITPSAGSLLVCTEADFQIGGDVGTISDDQGNTWRSLGYWPSGSNNTSSIWYALSVAGAVTQVTHGGNPNRSYINVQEYTGTSIGLVAPNRAWNSPFPASYRSGPITVPSGVALYVACWLNQTASATSLDGANGFTALTTVSSSLDFYSAYKIVGGGTAQEAVWTASSSDAYGHIGAWLESPSFIGLAPIAGRGASW
jgi:hypothetical protein